MSDEEDIFDMETQRLSPECFAEASSPEHLSRSDDIFFQATQPLNITSGSERKSPEKPNEEPEDDIYFAATQPLESNSERDLLPHSSDEDSAEISTKNSTTSPDNSVFERETQLIEWNDDTVPAEDSFVSETNNEGKENKSSLPETSPQDVYAAETQRLDYVPPSDEEEKEEKLVVPKKKNGCRSKYPNEDIYAAETQPLEYVPPSDGEDTEEELPVSQRNNRSKKQPEDIYAAETQPMEYVPSSDEEPAENESSVSAPNTAVDNGRVEETVNEASPQSRPAINDDEDYPMTPPLFQDDEENQVSTTPSSPAPFNDLTTPYRSSPVQREEEAPRELKITRRSDQLFPRRPDTWSQAETLPIDQYHSDTDFEFTYVSQSSAGSQNFTGFTASAAAKSSDSSEKLKAAVRELSDEEIDAAESSETSPETASAGPSTRSRRQPTRKTELKPGKKPKQSAAATGNEAEAVSKRTTRSSRSSALPSASVAETNSAKPKAGRRTRSAAPEAEPTPGPSDKSKAPRRTSRSSKPAPYPTDEETSSSASRKKSRAVSSSKLPASSSQKEMPAPAKRSSRSSKSTAILTATTVSSTAVENNHVTKTQRKAVKEPREPAKDLAEGASTSTRRSARLPKTEPNNNAAEITSSGRGRRNGSLPAPTSATAEQNPSTSQRKRRTESVSGASGVTVGPSPVKRGRGSSKRQAVQNPEEPSSCEDSAQSRKRRTSSGKLKVAFTGLDNEKQKKLVKKLGGAVTEESGKSSVLVSDKIRRTVKFLCAVGRGVPVVKPEWLEASFTAKKFADPWQFLLEDPQGEEKFGFSLQDSLEKAAANPVLCGWSLLATPKVLPPPSELKDIISAAGGRYAEDHELVSSEKTAIISCEDDKNQWRTWQRRGIPVVQAEAILSGILKQNFDPSKFKLC